MLWILLIANIDLQFEGKKLHCGLELVLQHFSSCFLHLLKKKKRIVTSSLVKLEYLLSNTSTPMCWCMCGICKVLQRR